MSEKTTAGQSVPSNELLYALFASFEELANEWKEARLLAPIGTKWHEKAELHEGLIRSLAHAIKKASITVASNKTGERTACPKGPMNTPEASAGQAVRSTPLLGGIDALVRPDYHDLNDRDERLLHAVLCAYAKHHLEHPDIGWEQLADILRDAICEEIGDDAFCKWLETMSANTEAVGRPAAGRTHEPLVGGKVSHK